MVFFDVPGILRAGKPRNTMLGLLEDVFTEMRSFVGVVGSQLLQGSTARLGVEFAVLLSSQNNSSVL